MYTLQEAVKYQAWDQLNGHQCDELLDNITVAEELANAVTCSDIPAAFISEDEADQPGALLWEFQAALLEGSKADRALAFQALDKALSEWALQRVRSTESGMEEWRELVKIAGRVPDHD